MSGLANPLKVEQRGIEPLTSALRTRRSAKLSYCPMRTWMILERARGRCQARPMFGRVSGGRRLRQATRCRFNRVGELRDVAPAALRHVCAPAAAPFDECASRAHECVHVAACVCGAGEDETRAVGIR